MNPNKIGVVFPFVGYFDVENVRSRQYHALLDVSIELISYKKIKVN